MLAGKRCTSTSSTHLHHCCVVLGAAVSFSERGEDSFCPPVCLEEDEEEPHHEDHQEEEEEEEEEEDLVDVLVAVGGSMACNTSMMWLESLICIE